MSDDTKTDRQSLAAKKAAQKQALAEAEARRAAHVAEKRASESGGQEGPEPTRYGDWEKDGIACDF